jgi:hypothetical protein
MFCRRILAGSLLLICGVAGTAKNKKKVILPTDILQAQTVLVVIDPDAGMAVDAPTANRQAQADVEQKLMNWGRFRLALNTAEADLVISVRKGSGKIVQPTIGGIPNNDPVIFQPSPTDPRGAGAGPRGSGPIGDSSQNRYPGPHPQLETGGAEDIFVVYRGQREDALDYPPVWRYVAKDGLRSPGVPAVEEFRKTIVEAEKQAANNP